VGGYGALAATPYVLMTGAMNKIGAGTPVNSFRFGERSTADNQPIVRPSPDLLYASCVFDVSDGPVIVTAEPIPGTYWSLSVFDARTDVAAVRSDRDTGGKAARLALVRAGQAAPPGYEAVALDHDKGIVLLRILADADNPPARLAAIEGARRQAQCRAAGRQD
jgi:hypothetical protein